MRVHICNFTTVENVLYRGARFDFSEMFGPLFIRQNGEPLKNQPQPGTSKWAAFEDWHAEYLKGKKK